MMYVQSCKHQSLCEYLPGQTVGALLSRAYQAGGCVAGAIFGTGTNGAYVEEVGKAFIYQRIFQY